MAQGASKKPAAAASSPIVRRKLAVQSGCRRRREHETFHRVVRSRRAGEELEREHARVLALVKQGLCLLSVDEQWKSDREIVLAAVQQDG
eukprot:6172472-Amphidinium_carterae.1